MSAEFESLTELMGVVGGPDDTAERLDALQARIELLERDRSTRLRETGARLRRLEQEREQLIRETTEAQVRVESSRREIDRLSDALDRAGQRVSELQGRLDDVVVERGSLELDRDRWQSAAGAEQAARARIEAHVADLLEERQMIQRYVERAAASRAWRIGHFLTSMARRITFRRNRGTSALGQLQHRLARSQPVLPPAPSNPADTDRAG